MPFKKKKIEYEGFPVFQRYQFEPALGKLPSYSQRLGEGSTSDQSLYPPTQWKLRARTARIKSILRESV
jgi:hypothetical protein